MTYETHLTKIHIRTFKNTTKLGNKMHGHDHPSLPFLSPFERQTTITSVACNLSFGTSREQTPCWFD